MERSGIEEINVQKPRFRVTPSRLLAAFVKSFRFMRQGQVASMERSGIEEINVQKPRFRVTPSRLLTL